MLGSVPGYRAAPVTWLLIATNVVVFLLLEVNGGSEDPRTLLRWGAKYGPAISDGEWWRFITPIFLHVGVLHLIANTIALFAFAGTVELIFGSVTFAAIYLLSGVTGNVASVWASPALGAGASGAAFGIVGAFGVYLLLNRRVMGRFGSQALISVGFIIAINLVFGFATSTVDNFAHLGGLFGGAALSFLLAPRERAVPRTGSFYMGAVGAPATIRPNPLASAAILAAAAVLIALLAYAVSGRYS